MDPQLSTPANGLEELVNALQATLTPVTTSPSAHGMLQILLYQPENPCLLVLQGSLPTKPGAEDLISDSDLL
ncbi:hypothetical protein QQF64_022219 [Cirrhinus molitorella]|uniref:Uncharacterized protein n=1 Tax=Cirrhinus molitorella TaxID=172907 RepID=A0ABR3L7K2_9TELE